MTPAERLVAAVQAKGSDARDARDAAHEACHALEWEVFGRWTRDNVHDHKPEGNRSDGVRDEITARAVEALVCAKLDIPHDLKKWAMTCWMEMLKNEGISLPLGDWLKDAIEMRMTTKHAQDLADKVLALADEAETVYCEDVHEKRRMIVYRSNFACPYCGRSVDRGGHAEGFRKSGMTNHVHACWEICIYLRGYFIGPWVEGVGKQRAIPVAEAANTEWLKRYDRSIKANMRRRKKDGELEALTSTVKSERM